MLNYHARTQLKGGRLSMIVDPGAWANLIGEDLADALIKRAKKNGLDPFITEISPPVLVSGVGDGSQKCTRRLNCPIGVHSEGTGPMISNLNAPIVSGKGSDLPGLLGLQSLEASRAVLDVGGRKLHLLGPGELQMTLPPGTRSIPLTKAPSGHLVMIIDD